MHSYVYPSFLINIFLSTGILFAVVIVKLLWTRDITRPMRKLTWNLSVDDLSDKFKKWKFIVIGTLAGIANIVLSVSGAKLSGVLQLILLQGLYSHVSMLNLF